MTVDLKIDWATHEAAKHACLNWHYSKSIPVGPMVKVGAWENGSFIGVILFSHGANNNIGGPYSLGQDECVELTRVAMRKHITPVSQVMMAAIKMLKKENAKLRMIVSYADTAEGHHGGIYQATNWVYVGHIDQKSKAVFQGKIAHKRTFDAAGIKGYHLLPSSLKHKYLMPLDKKMRKQILPLSKPYPKREVLHAEG